MSDCILGLLIVLWLIMLACMVVHYHRKAKEATCRTNGGQVPIFGYGDDEE